MKLAFAPTTRGSKSAALSISGNTLAGTASVALSGTGQGPVVSFDRGAASFDAAATGTSSEPLSVTLTNNGETPLSLSAIAIGGTDGSQFSRAAGPSAGTCDTSAAIAAGSSCTIGLVFSPSADGLKNASLTVSSDAPAGIASLPLSGTGAQPEMALDESPVDFGDSPLNYVGDGHTLIVRNTGVAPVTLTSVALTGPDAADFWGVTDGPIGRCSDGTVLHVAESCLLQVFFVPKSPGEKTATISVSSNAGPASHSPLGQWRLGPLTTRRPTTVALLRRSTAEHLRHAPGDDSRAAARDRDGKRVHQGDEAPASSSTRPSRSSAPRATAAACHR